MRVTESGCIDQVVNCSPFFRDGWRRPCRQHSEAGHILKSLVDGRDPESGKDLPPETVLQRAQVIRALLIARDSIETCVAREKRRAMLPVRVGIQWTDEEDEKLRLAFREGANIEFLAGVHQRTPRAIQARLEKLQLIPIDENVSLGFRAKSAEERVESTYQRAARTFVHARWPSVIARRTFCSSIPELGATPPR